MARKDILIDIETGGFLVENKNEDIKPIEASVLPHEDGMLDKHIYIEAVGEDLRVLLEDIYISVPYHPVDMSGYIRLGSRDSFGNMTFVRNPIDNTIWFQITSEGNPISISRLAMISNVGRYTARYNPEVGSMDFYNMDEVDMSVNESAYQDAMLIIKANKGGILKHPTSGVEIFKYLHSSTGGNELGRAVHNELLDDGIITNTANIDDKGNISLDIEEENKGYEEKQ